MKQVLFILFISLLASSSASAGNAWALWEVRFIMMNPNDPQLLTFQAAAPVSSWESPTQEIPMHSVSSDFSASTTDPGLSAIHQQGHIEPDRL